MDSIGQLLAIMRESEYTVYCNAQIKRYPDGGAIVTVFDRNIIRAPGFELVGPQQPPELPEAAEAGEDTPEQREGKDAANLARSKRRARAAVYDLSRATQFEYFATFTVDPEKVKDRFDDEEVFRHLHDWLDNNVRRRGLCYVLVPEYHKRGGLHFHALMNDALPRVDSGTVILPGGGKPRRPRSAAQRAAWLEAGGQVVYNVSAWGWGFSTAMKLYGDQSAAINYVCKYITKSEKKIGGRWYYSGGDLKRPRVSTCKLDFSAAAAQGVEPFEIDELGARGVRLHVEGEWLDETLEELCRTPCTVRD